MIICDQRISEGGQSIITVAGIIIHPLGVHYIVHCDNIIILAHRTTSYASKLLHMSAYT